MAEDLKGGDGARGEKECCAHCKAFLVFGGRVLLVLSARKYSSYCFRQANLIQEDVLGV